MAHKRRKKNTRLRGSKTHGWGAMKKHRGAGHRGGRGNAGSGKRGDAKKPSYWAIKNYAGKRGFTGRGVVHCTMNVGHVSSSLDRFVTTGVAKTGARFVIDLAHLGVTRLLGGGVVNKPLELTVLTASPKAVEKIVAAGGVVHVTAPSESAE